ncbi:GNAT family N-acetyltransferase [Polaromonas sp. CT11-55]|uniref:GNAT family N-acetyltransferase n=1 Tax=Polaromonas sp. CT11-55 TaxID=3243045 RepID=UPI0039A4A774
MQIRSFQQADASDVFRLLTANGWQHRIPSMDYLRELVVASQRVIVAVDGSRVIGFARAITDGLSNGYLSMVVVEASCRGQGIGTQLVERIVGDEPQVTWVLRAGREGAREFFSKLGFSASAEAMERVRRAATR